MAVYRSQYSLALSADNTYTPPSLPSHILAELEPIIRAPSNEQLKAVQHAVRVAESLVTSPLFNHDLSMQLSQHLFNLQFARYIQDSTLGRFASKPEESRNVPQESKSHSSSTPSNTGASAPSEPVRAGVPEVECRCAIATEITRQGKVMNDVKETLNESKGILENMNRVLIATQRNQVTVGEWNNHNYAHINPVNEQGVTAAECGLPQLRFTYHQGGYWNHLKAPALAGYLKFFGISGELLEESESPCLKSGQEQEARRVILKHIGWSV